MELEGYVEDLRWLVESFENATTPSDRLLRATASLDAARTLFGELKSKLLNGDMWGTLFECKNEQSKTLNVSKRKKKIYSNLGVKIKTRKEAFYYTHTATIPKKTVGVIIGFCHRSYLTDLTRVSVSLYSKKGNKFLIVPSFQVYLTDMSPLSVDRCAGVLPAWANFMARTARKQFDKAKTDTQLKVIEYISKMRQEQFTVTENDAT